MGKSAASIGFVRMLAWAGLALGWLAPPAAVAQAEQTPGPEAGKANSLVSGYCTKCHNSEDWSGGLAFDTLDLNHAAQDPETWEKAIGRLRGRLMPPAGEKQPPQADVDSFVAYLESSVDAAPNARHVGHTPIQRLSRTEFAASVQGLIGVDVDPRQILPTEIEVEGFDNIAQALGISPSFTEQYLSAARHLARRAIGEPVPKLTSTNYLSDGGTQRSPTANQLGHRDGYPLGTRGGMSFTHVFPADGEYRFSVLDVDAGLYPRGVETDATLVVLIDGKEVARRQIGGPEDLARADRDGPEGREAIIAKVTGIPAQVTAGSHQVIATFIERSWAASDDLADPGKFSGMPRIQAGIQVVGPFTPHGLSLSRSRAKIFICQPAGASEERPCAERIARHLATEAFRRQVTDADVTMLMKFYDAGRTDAGGFDSGVTELVTAILSSPKFLYRAISTSEQAEQSRPLGDLELASRLSFLLWNQGPDDELIGLATRNRLSDPAVTHAQVERMLKDPRAEALVDSFARSWLNLDDLEQVQPQDKEFDAAMRGNFETEVRLFIASVLLGNRSVLDLLNADYTFVNESLARQYDIPGVYGPQFRRVTLSDNNRWGLLGKGAVLLRTSYADRTSPVLRGEWVLDRIVGTPPTPPPPGVVTDLSIHEGQKVTTVRARLEAHRSNPTCRGCHGVIDPLGLALENFDVTGRWRTVDAAAKAPIDASSELSSGTILHGPADLRRYLTRRPDQFATTVTRRLMMYAINRELEYYDMPQIRQIVHNASAKNYTFESILMGVIDSNAFRRQGGAETRPNAAHPSKVASTDSNGGNATAIRGR